MFLGDHFTSIISLEENDPKWAIISLLRELDIIIQQLESKETLNFIFNQIIFARSLIATDQLLYNITKKWPPVQVIFGSSANRTTMVNGSHKSC